MRVVCAFLCVLCIQVGFAGHPGRFCVGKNMVGCGTRWVIIPPSPPLPPKMHAKRERGRIMTTYPVMPNEPVRFNFAENSRGSERGLQPQIKDKLTLISDVFRQKTHNPRYTIAITAGQEWHHGHGLLSLHHTGFAVDLRTRDLPGGSGGHIAKTIASELQQKLGSNYFVQLETARAHIHVQFSPGLRISNPGDFNTPASGSRMA